MVLPVLESLVGMLGLGSNVIPAVIGLTLLFGTLVDELVRLSKKHGVLTPYTSFLADDIGGIDELALRGAASERLESLSEVSGEEAFYGRAAKAEFKSAEQASGRRLRELAQNVAPAGPARTADVARPPSPDAIAAPPATVVMSSVAAFTRRMRSL